MIWAQKKLDADPKAIQKVESVGKLNINVQEQIRIIIRNVKDKWENFQDEELSHELFPTTRQKLKLRRSLLQKWLNEVDFFSTC